MMIAGKDEITSIKCGHMIRLVGLFLVLLLVPVYPLAAQEPSAAEAEKTAPPVETETAQPVTIEEACRSLEGAATKNGIQRRSRKFGQRDRWSFCLMAGTLCPSNQERL